MAYIEPNSTLHLLAGINIDQDYNHTLFFQSRQEQAQFFLGRARKSCQNLTYTRKGRGVIRIDCVPEQVYGCNYMMYKNTAFNPQNVDRWIYAFVEKVEYVNNKCAEVYFTVDRIQTWMFDYVLGDCLVDREHTLTDNPGDYIFPENLTAFDYTYHSTMHYEYKPKAYAAVLYTTEPFDSPDEGYDIYELNYEDGRFLYGMMPTNLHVYPGIALSEADFNHYFNNDSNRYFCAFKYHNPSSTSNVPPTLSHILRLIADGEFALFGGGGPSTIETVAGVFIVPIEALEVLTQIVREDAVPYNGNNLVGGRTTLPVTRFDRFIYGNETYIPRNAKLFTYPFSYYRLSDYSGNAQELRVEYFGQDERFNKINIDQNWLGSSASIAYPTNYKGVSKNRFNSLYISRSFGVGYSGNNLNEFLNRNTWAMIGKTAANFSGLPMASADYFVASAKADALLSSAHSTMNAVNDVKGVVSDETRMIGVKVGSQNTAKAFGIQQSAGTALGNNLVSAMTKTAGDLVAFGIGMQTALAIPDKSYLTTSPDNFTCGDGFDGIALYAMIPVLESAKQIDDYFDRFGYKLLTTHRPYVDCAKTRSDGITKSSLRKYWNYIKTVDCVVHHADNNSIEVGYSAEDESIIASIYNKGITFWFDNDIIGEYNTYRGGNSIFNPSPVPPPPIVITPKTGIDISRFNVPGYWSGDEYIITSPFDIDQVVESGGEYAFFRIGGADGLGDTTDVAQDFYFDGAFADNYERAIQAGLKVGAYYLVNCMTVEEARAEVQHIVSLFEKFGYPLLEGGFWLDIELNPVPEGKVRRFTRATAEVQDAMIREIRAGIINGIYPYEVPFVGLYTNPNGLENEGFKNLPVYSELPLWLAYWTENYTISSPPDYVKQKAQALPQYPVIWQYGQNIFGIRDPNNTIVDGDYIYPAGWTPN